MNSNFEISKPLFATQVRFVVANSANVLTDMAPFPKNAAAFFLLENGDVEVDVVSKRHDSFAVIVRNRMFLRLEPG